MFELLYDKAEEVFFGYALYTVPGAQRYGLEWQRILSIKVSSRLSSTAKASTARRLDDAVHNLQHFIDSNPAASPNPLAVATPRLT